MHLAAALAVVLAGKVAAAAEAVVLALVLVMVQSHSVSAEEGGP
jgi:hypothetical protein